MNNREKLQNELKNLLKSNAFIYGCGIVGKRLYDVICSIKMQNRISGFIVSDLKSDDDVVYRNKTIQQLTDIKDKNIFIIVAVSDAYQNEILFYLRKHGFKNIFNGYLYSFINEKHLPDCLPEDVPNNFMIDLNELMIMQCEDNTFYAYDILLAKMQGRTEKLEKKCDYTDNIIVDRQMRIVQGRQVVAAALCANAEFITVEQCFEDNAPIFDKQWLKQHYDIDEIKKIEEYLDLCRRKWMKPLLGIIWPNAYKISNRILKDIASYSHTSIGKIRDIQFNNADDFESFVRKLYNTDDMDKWKIDLKLERMLLSSKLEIKAFDFYLEQPRFRIKRFGHTISDSGMSIKNAIRMKYNQEIPNYIEDIILHTTDNYNQAYEARDIIQEFFND